MQPVRSCSQSTEMAVVTCWRLGIRSLVEADGRFSEARYARILFSSPAASEGVGHTMRFLEKTWRSSEPQGICLQTVVEVDSPTNTCDS